MRRHPRSDGGRRIRIGRKLRGEGAAAAAEIGSRISSLRAPPPASMPSVGARRSTKVFVPKCKPSGAGAGHEATAGRVLRSGKRFALSKPLSKRGHDEEGEGNEWPRLFGGCGGLRWYGRDRKEVAIVPDGWPLPLAQLESDALGHMADTGTGSSETRSFGVVYSRKRSRPKEDGGISLSSSTEDSEYKDEKRYGIVFARKQRRTRPKVAPLFEEVSGETGMSKEVQQCNTGEEKVGGWQLRIPDAARSLASEAGISGNALLTSVKCPVMLVVLVESSYSGTSPRFAQFFVSLLRWMGSSRMRMWEYVAFLMAGSIASVYSLHGIHFLPALQTAENIMLESTLASCGFCKIYGARKFVPVVSLHFSALPSYFKSLHASILLGSQYLPVVLRRYLMGLCSNSSVVAGAEENGSLMLEQASSVRTEIVFDVAGAKGEESYSLTEARTSLTQNAGAYHGLRFRKHQKKRSSSRHSRSRQLSLPMLHAGAISPNQMTAGRHLVAKSSSAAEHVVQPIHAKSLDICLGDFLVDDSDVSTPNGSYGKQRRSDLKSPVERTNEKLALAEAKQNIDSVHCKANILVILADRCWREEGVEVMLEVSNSDGWFIAVKMRDTMRIVHKPQDLKPCVVNHYTHAYVWALDDGAKLEFLDRWDWLLFKELHVECQVRNSQVKIIPVPGVQEVSGYVDIVTAPFLRPGEYIRTPEDEVGRALARDDPLYDMDSGDEKWLNQRNASLSDEKSSDTSHMSEDDFEKTITMLEKDAYNNPEKNGDFESLLNRCQDTGKGDFVVALYDYWIRKRNIKGAALVRFFQGAPLRRTQLIQKPFLRKKRSFKRQRSQAGRGNPAVFLQDWGEEGALRRVKEAEAAASRVEQSAIHLRRRAQMLMANADLAAYKSVMAFRIANAMQASDNPDPDLASSVID